MTYRIDLHTHSTGSPDGGISLDDYRAALDKNQLDCIAITDHDHIATAQVIQRRLGSERIIVGDEISTTDGELIGLYLSELVPAGLSAQQTAEHIRNQGGLVYAPHPFETVRHGVSQETLDAISELVDIVEVNNGRAVFQNRSAQANDWAKDHKKPGAASSDAHGKRGLGTTYTVVESLPSKENLCDLLHGAALIYGRAPWLSLLYPKYHRLRKKAAKS
jgi:predicted metal-dependent phosphoesterase TrpH